MTTPQFHNKPFSLSSSVTEVPENVQSTIEKNYFLLLYLQCLIDNFTNFIELNYTLVVFRDCRSTCSLALFDPIALKLETQLKSAFCPLTRRGSWNVFAKISTKILNVLSHFFCVLTTATHSHACTFRIICCWLACIARSWPAAESLLIMKLPFDCSLWKRN